MATYVNDLRLKEIATGDESGTWGTSTNQNLELIAEAFSFGTEAIITNADTHTTTIADGSTDPGRSLFLKYTGTLDSACTITIGPNTVSKLWFIENATSGSQNIIIKQGSGATVTIANGQTKAIYSDGAGSGGAMVDAFTDLAMPSLFLEGALTGTTATFTTADNTAQVALVSTDADASDGPILEMFRNSSSPADDDDLGIIKFFGENDASEKIEYGIIEVKAVDVSDGTEDGSINITAILNGTARSRLFSNSTETVFNEGSQDLDFRVESNGDANALFVDAGNDKIGVLTNAPSGQFHVYNGMLQVGSKTGDTSVQQNANAIRIAAVPDSSTEWGGLQWYREFSDYIGAEIIAARASSTESDTDLIFKTSTSSANATERMRISHDGKVLIGQDSGDSFNADSMLRLGRSGDRIFIQLKTTAQDSGVLFGDEEDDVECAVQYDNANKALKLTADNGNERLRVGTTESVFNEDSENIDFRVESNGNTHMLFVDAGAECVNIGGSTDQGGVLNIEGADSDMLVLHRTADTGDQSILFKDHGDHNATITGKNGGGLELRTNGNSTTALELASDGLATFGSGGGVIIDESAGGDNLTLRSTNSGGASGPILVLNRNSSSPNDGDDIGQIRFDGRNSANQNTTYAKISANLADATDGTEDGGIYHFTISGGAEIQRMSLVETETVFNEQSRDLDFRVESDISADCFFIDAGNDIVLIKNSGGAFQGSTATSMHVRGGSTGSTSPIMMITDGDGSVEGDSTILEVSFTGDGSFSEARYITFRAGSSTQGAIKGTGDGTVTYGTSSDERLKENIEDTASKWDALKAIKVRDFNWKNSGNSDTGFIAQELNEHWPNAVSEGGENLSHDPWSVDYGKLTPILTKALQEAMEKIETLEAEVAKLKGE